MFVSPSLSVSVSLSVSLDISSLNTYVSMCLCHFSVDVFSLASCLQTCISLSLCYRLNACSF